MNFRVNLDYRCRSLVGLLLRRQRPGRELNIRSPAFATDQYIWPRLHFPENLFSRIFTKQNLRLVENTFPRKLIFQKLHFHKNSFSRNHFSFEKLFYV